VNVKEELDHTLIGLLALLILVSIVMVLIIFGLKYIIVQKRLSRQQLKYMEKTKIASNPKLISMDGIFPIDVFNVKRASISP